jgi:drug/metabolite transporter (DMT)-like permease
VSARAWAAFGAVSTLWGIPYLFIKVAVDDGVPPLFLAWVRVALGAAVLLALSWHAGLLGSLRGRWRWIAVYGVIEISIPFPLIAAGERHVASSLAAILIASVPLIIALLALRFDHSERVGGRRLVGLFIGLGGALLIAALVLTPFGLATPPSSGPSGQALLSLVVLGLFCTAAAFVFFGALIAEVGPSRASVITYVAPVVAVTLGVTVLGERPGVGAVAGLLLILAGSWLSTDGRLPQPLSFAAGARPAGALICHVRNRSSRRKAVPRRGGAGAPGRPAAPG